MLPWTPRETDPSSPRAAYADDFLVTDSIFQMMSLSGSADEAVRVTTDVMCCLRMTIESVPWT